MFRSFLSYALPPCSNVSSILILRWPMFSPIFRHGKYSIFKLQTLQTCIPYYIYIISLYIQQKLHVLSFFSHIIFSYHPSYAQSKRHIHLWTAFARRPTSRRRCSMNWGNWRRVSAGFQRKGKDGKDTFQKKRENSGKSEKYIWKYMGNIWEIYGNIWKYMETYGNIWKYMETYGNIWKHMEIYENIWKYMEIYGNIWKYMETYGNIWKYMEICRWDGNL